jgi:hypothetical protein
MGTEMDTSLDFRGAPAALSMQNEERCFANA